MKRILLISFSHYPTLQNYLYLLKENLQEKRCDVYSIGNRDISTLYKTGDNSFFITCEESASPTVNNIKRYLVEKKKIKKIIKNISPDIIIFTSKHIWNFFLIIWLLRKNMKIYHVFHDPIGHSGTTVSKGVVYYNKILSKMIDGVITHSEVSYQNTLKYIKPKCPVKMTALGEKKWLDYLEREMFQNRLLIFGRISTYKGCEFIPKIARRLKERNIDCKIVVAGKCLDDVPNDFAGRLSQYSNIEYINSFIEEKELDKYFFSCDASLILHKSISQSGVIIDAYRHSQPIFCFDVEGMNEFAVKETAYISKPFDFENMVDNIETMYSDIEKYKEKSKLAYLFGKEKFSEKRMAADIYNFVN